MNKVEITQRVRFSCAYILKYSSFSELNSHDYVFECTLIQQHAIQDNRASRYNRILNFEDLQSIMMRSVPDKTFIYTNFMDDKGMEMVNSIKRYGVPCECYDEIISTESILGNISLILVGNLRKEFGDQYSIKETKLRENTNSYVTWKPEEDK